MNNSFDNKPSFIPGIKNSVYKSADGHALSVGEIVHYLSLNSNNRYDLKSFAIINLKDNNRIEVERVYNYGDNVNRKEILTLNSSSFWKDKNSLLQFNYYRTREVMDLDLRPKLESLTQLMHEHFPDFDQNNIIVGEGLNQDEI